MDLQNVVVPPPHGFQKRGELPTASAAGHEQVFAEIHNESRKRKRGSTTTAITTGESKGEDEHLFGESFVIQSPNDKLCPEIELLPKALIAREQLPLHFLASHDGKCTRLFRGRVDAFGKQSLVTDSHPRSPVLLARDVRQSRLVAIENVRNDLFSLCHLQPWVEVDDFDHRPSKVSKISAEDPHTSKEEAWWRAAQLESGSPNGPAKSQPRVSKYRLSMRVPGLEKETGVRAQPRSKLEQFNDEKESNAPYVTNDPEPALEQYQNMSPEQLAETLRNQYLEALYISRTSLAYFAKGPLTRARLSAQGGLHSPSIELTDCLRSMVLTVPMSNRKYAEALNEIVNEIPSGLTNEDQESLLDGPIRDRLRKCKKRKKVTKNGLFKGEEEFVIQWWVNREASQGLMATSADTREKRMQMAREEQRTRETQLQIILIIEILALEMVSEKDSLGRLVNDGETAEQQPETPKPSKKLQDLSSTLDALIDRLCIWESVNSDGPESTNQKTENSALASKNEENGRLRDFCAEVIVPFYATRLPELYSRICQKLGLGAATSSPQANAKTPGTMRKKTTTKPGAAVQRPMPHPHPKLKKSSSSMNMATVTKRGPLSRSATDSQLSVTSTLKRELTPGALDLSSIPAHHHDDRRQRRQPSLLSTQRYEKREVDLVAAVGLARSKAAAAAEREKEKELLLQGAIAALRKPNARLAVKEFVDGAEKRAGIAGAAAMRSQRAGRANGGGGRKKGEPIRNPFAEGALQVQVAATPRVNRWGRPMGSVGGMGVGEGISAAAVGARGFQSQTALQIGRLGVRAQSQLGYEHAFTQPDLSELDVVPPSSVEARIPSSTTKIAEKGLLGQTRLFPLGGGAKERRSIEATPSRKRSQGASLSLAGARGLDTVLEGGEDDDLSYINADDDNDNEPELPALRVPNSIAKNKKTGISVEGFLEKGRKRRASVEAMMESTPCKRQRQRTIDFVAVAAPETPLKQQRRQKQKQREGYNGVLPVASSVPISEIGAVATTVTSGEKEAEKLYPVSVVGGPSASSGTLLGKEIGGRGENEAEEEEQKEPDIYAALGWDDDDDLI